MMDKKTPLMKCGHAANAKDSKGNPVCVICVGIHPGAKEIEEESPDLSNRKAICSYGHAIVPSSTELAFFEYLPKEEYDRYYCGCKGWD